MNSRLRNLIVYRLKARLQKTNVGREVDFYYDRIPGVTELRPHEIQEQVWNSKSRFLLIPAGRGSGKTELAKRKLVQCLPKKRPWHDPRYFYGAPTLKQAKRIAWNDLKALVPRSWIADPDDIKEGELTIRTIFGSTLTVVGLDQPQRVEGVQWDGCVIDECSDIKPGTFELSILPALTHRDGWCWRIGVPKRQGVGAAEFREHFEKATRNQLPYTTAFTWASSTVLSSEQLAFAQQSMDPRDFREQFGACFESAGGGIFYAFDRELHVRPVSYDPQKPILVSSDFNVDPMCWVLCHSIEGQLFVFDELFRRNTNTLECLDILAKKYRSHKTGWRFFGDAAARQRSTTSSKTNLKLISAHPEFIQMGRTLHYPKANPPIAERFAATNSVFMNAAGETRAYVDPNCVHLIKDFGLRTYKPGTMQPQDSGDIGHMTDAFGYIVYRLFPLTLYKATGSMEPVIEGDENGL